MNPFNRKNPNKKPFPGEKNAVKIPQAEEKLGQINKLKQQIVDYFNQGKLRRVHTCLNYLRENQAETPKLLAKSLCDLAESIFDNEIKRELLEEAVELNPYDSVTLTSYAIFLAANNQYEPAFDWFEQSLRLKSEETVTLTSYATALANSSQSEVKWSLNCSAIPFFKHFLIAVHD